MIPPQARDILLYYGGLIVLALIIFFRPKGRRSGMRLRFHRKARQVMGEPERSNIVEINGATPKSPEKFSHIRAPGERPLNVIFNYNGHSWDAYEVLGLPAGSGPEKVDQSYREALASVDAGSRHFLEAAYRAIQAEWRTFKASGTR